MIIVSITGPTMHDALAQVAASSRWADMVEFRLDLITQPDIAKLCVSTRKPVIATCRPKEEGGRFSGSAERRFRMLMQAARSGAAFVDVELSAGQRAREEIRSERPETALIVSRHLSARDRPAMERIYASLRAARSEVVKFAFHAHDAADNRMAFDFLARARKDRLKAIAIAMGDEGEASRVLYRKFGGWATYASATEEAIAAPGQLSARVLKDLYRADRIDARTRILGVVGHPLRQSKGIFLHNPLLQKNGVSAVYCRFPVVDLARFMNEMAPLLAGFSVTIPHKEAILSLLHEVDATARAIGAVNTVVHRQGRFRGTNTDAPGALDAIESVMKVYRKRMLILGAGGAARAIAFEARQRGADVCVVNRTNTRAVRMAHDLGVRALHRNRLRSAGRFDIIANATSVGMLPAADASPLPEHLLDADLVFDAVYAPPMTKLLREAQRKGARVVPGTEMYVRQAVRQFLLYTGKNPGIVSMKRMLKRLDS